MAWTPINRILMTFLLLGAFACKKQVDAPEMGFEYFGLTKGRYIDYEVTEIKHDKNQTPKSDTVNYFMRTLIGDTIIDNEGRIARRFYRYKRSDTTQNWQFSDLYTAIILNGRAELVEENQRYIKLVFATTEEKNWNPNAFTTQNSLNCYYTDLHLAKTINGLFYPSTLIVEQENFYESVIDKRRKYEIYAKGIGMVLKHSKDINHTYLDTNNIIKGNELYMKCIAYGFQ
jgi:hypothetical protein